MVEMDPCAAGSHRSPAQRHYRQKAQVAEFIPHLHFLDNQKSCLSMSENIKHSIIGSYANTVVSNLRRYPVQLPAQSSVSDEV